MVQCLKRNNIDSKTSLIYSYTYESHPSGHVKLRGRVLRVRRVLRRQACINMKPVQCQHGCYIMKQHCLWCVRAGEN